MSDLDFDLIIGGIEDGIIAALAPLRHRTVNNEETGYVKRLESYGGELDAAKLREALNSLTPQLPLMLVSYADGEDELDPPIETFDGSPRFYRHDCSFTVICCSGNARGEKARRRGVVSAVGIYKMLADVRALLCGVQIKATLEGDDNSFTLNSEPLRAAGIEYIARLAGLTAYAAHFDTWFRWRESDRAQPEPLVRELVIEVMNTFEKGESNLPGVILK